MTASLIFSEPKPSGLDIERFIESSPIAVLRLDATGAIIEANQCFRTLMRDSLPVGGRLALPLRGRSTWSRRCRLGEAGLALPLGGRNWRRRRWLGGLLQLLLLLLPGIVLDLGQRIVHAHGATLHGRRVERERL